MPEPSANSPSDQADASEQTAAAPERDAIDPGAPDQAVRDQTVAEPGAPDQAIPAQPGSGPAGGAIGVWLRGRGRRLAIAAGVVVVSVGIALWWQYRSFYAALSEQDRVLVEALEIARASQRELEQQLATLRAALEQRNAELNTRAAELADLRADLDPLPIELRALERSIDELQGGRVDARASWLREQAEYYLVLANAELRLGGRIATAIEALTQADGVLRTLGEPRLASVRAAIADELQALRVIDPPDVEGLALALGNLGDQADELPLRDQTPDSLELAAAGDDETGESAGLGRLWSQARGAVTSIVRVERQAGSIEQLLTETERRLVRRRLGLELQLARTAAIEGRQADLRASLVAADAILDADFNTDARSVVAARELLASMRQIELEPVLPDISDSLRLIRIAAGTR